MLRASNRLAHTEPSDYTNFVFAKSGITGKMEMVVPKLRAPIVLVHGLLGFNRVMVAGYTLARYFPGIPDFLGEAGNRVMIASLSPTEGVASRAAQLKNFIDRELPGEPVHILAHSMGGLDSRYMIGKLGMAERVLSLTTIGTPHRGSTFADWGVRRFERVLKPLLEIFDVPHQAFYDLTTAKCREFNEQIPDQPGVRYFSVAGRHPNAGWRARMKLIHMFVHRTEGPNDGIVSVESARWGETFEEWQGDHLSLVNWPDASGLNVDRKPDYARLLGRLADEGF
jgi:triacylglycerol lipase